jgi:hypothetical protein
MMAELEAVQGMPMFKRNQVAEATSTFGALKRQSTKRCCVTNKALA